MLTHMQFTKICILIAIIIALYALARLWDWIINKAKDDGHEDLGDGFSYTVEYDGLVCIIRLFYKGKEFNDRKFKDQDMDFIQNFIIGEVRKYKIGLRGIDSIKRSKELIKQQIKNGIQN